ncbi:unnamed protein product [Arctia plantaginis]|uniref:Uncharacterized protein n=1 Tax=Arctia plantaginis TaxID=874455 RepID=A0A8S1B076_ARCPL|nr:unnamed protein product [Arctia plantaginis]
MSGLWRWRERSEIKKQNLERLTHPVVVRTRKAGECVIENGANINANVEGISMDPGLLQQVWSPATQLLNYTCTSSECATLGRERDERVRQ